MAECRVGPGKGQSKRLGIQHELASGPLGIFGEEAKKHDAGIRDAVSVILKSLRQRFPNLDIRHRNKIDKAVSDQFHHVTEISK